MKTYTLKPAMPSTNLTTPATPCKTPVPPHQPPPSRAEIVSAKPLLKLGLDVHLESILAVAQSFLITPVALNGQRKTDKLEARALCLRLSRWLDVNRDELAPFASPPKPNNPFAKPSAAANSSRAESADLLTVDWPGRRGLPRRTSRPLAGRAQLEETFPLHLKKQFPINISLS